MTDNETDLANVDSGFISREIALALAAPALAKLWSLVFRSLTPKLMRAKTDAIAYEIETLPKSFKKVAHLPFPIKVKGEHVWMTNEGCRASPPDAIAAPERHLLVDDLQRIKRRENVEAIVEEAADILYGETEASPEPVDEDWANGFFRIAEDISTDKMRKLWGHVLAGEIKHPGSFSLRTLDTLRSMTQSDANLFQRACNLSAWDPRRAVILKPTGFEANKEYELRLQEILLLVELGLISDAIQVKYNIKAEAPPLMFITDNYLLRLTSATDIAYAPHGKRPPKPVLTAPVG